MSDHGSFDPLYRAVKENKVKAAISLIQQNESLAVVRTILTSFVKTFCKEMKASDDTIESEALQILTLILEKKDILGVDIDGNTPLHISTRSKTDDLTKFILANGGSASQFTRNKEGKIPKSLKTTNDDISRLLVIDFISFALKSSEFETKDFQDLLGSGKKNFSLQPLGKSSSLLEFILQRGMIKEREELLMLLMKIDKYRNKKEEDGDESMKRIINVLRAGIGPCRELKECLDSLSEKFPWTNGKVAVMSLISVIKNMIIGGGFYVADIYTDTMFAFYMFEQYYNFKNTNTSAECQYDMDRQILEMQRLCEIGKESTREVIEMCQLAAKNVSNFDCLLLQRFSDKNEYQLIGTVSCVHVILPFAITIMIFINLCIRRVIELNRFTILKFPIPPISKFYKTMIEVQTFKNNTKRENFKEYDANKDKLIRKLDDQNKLTNISMLIEAGAESSFQFLFQSLYLLPTIMLAFTELSSVSDLSGLIDFKILSILISFVTFSWSSFNIR